MVLLKAAPLITPFMLATVVLVKVMVIEPTGLMITPGVGGPAKVGPFWKLSKFPVKTSDVPTLEAVENT